MARSNDTITYNVNKIPNLTQSATPGSRVVAVRGASLPSSDGTHNVVAYTTQSISGLNFSNTSLTAAERRRLGARLVGSTGLNLQSAFDAVHPPVHGPVQPVDGSHAGHLPQPLARVADALYLAKIATIMKEFSKLSIAALAAGTASLLLDRLAFLFNRLPVMPSGVQFIQFLSSKVTPYILYARHRSRRVAGACVVALTMSLISEIVPAMQRFRRLHLPAPALGSLMPSAPVPPGAPSSADPRSFVFENSVVSTLVEPATSETTGDAFVEETGDDTFWRTPGEKHHKLPLTAEEVKHNKYGCEAAEYSHWRAKVLSFFELRNPKAAALMRLSFAEAALVIIQHPFAAEANTWLASALRSLLDVSKRDAELLEKDLIEKEIAEPGVSCSGIDIAELICHRMTQRDTCQEERDWAELQRTTYIKGGMSDVEVRLAVKRIKAKMRVVQVARRTAPNALLRMIVDKIPSSPAALVAEKQKYLRALDLAEKLGEVPTIESKPLMIERLTEYIVIDLAAHTGGGSSEVSAAERARREEQQRKSKKGPCQHCKDPNHHWSACPKNDKPCVTCKKPWCQGAPHIGKICFIELLTIPDYKDALGEPLHPSLQKTANELRKAKGRKVAEASALECEPADDEEEFGLVSPGEPRIVELNTCEISSNTGDDAEVVVPEASMLEVIQPFDGPPHHVHKWWWDHGPCIACNSDLMWVCRTCGASWCQCIGIPRPFYGPAVPGPVWWGALDSHQLTAHRRMIIHGGT